MAERTVTPRYIHFQSIASKIEDSTAVADAFFVQVPVVKDPEIFDSGLGDDCALSVHNASTLIRTSPTGEVIPANRYDITVKHGDYGESCTIYIKYPSVTASVNRACVVQCFKELSVWTKKMVSFSKTTPFS